jgi:septal ring factor EnvC (AmiA/AmiB activator)
VSIDTEALLATLAEGIDPGHPTVFFDALDTFAAELRTMQGTLEIAADQVNETEAELERLRHERDSCRSAYNKQADVRREMEAELERVKVERDGQREEKQIARASAAANSALLDKALAALRTIGDLDPGLKLTHEGAKKRARAAIAEIEEE